MSDKVEESLDEGKKWSGGSRPFRGCGLPLLASELGNITLRCPRTLPFAHASPFACYVLLQK